MSTKKQERARARRRYEKLAAKQARRQARRERNRRVVAVVAVVLVVVGGAVALARTVDTGGSATASSSAAASSSGSSASSASPSSSGQVTCSTAPPAPGTVGKLDLPSKKVAQGKTFTGVITTNCGNITVQLYGAKAPQTVASFVNLAQKQYWRNSPCHRLTTSGIYVLQCGDPTGTGSGGPGYTFGIENAPSNGDYPRGTLAMARTSDPNSNGGQFFIVYKDSKLPTSGGGYSIFGKVTGGMDIVDHIAAAGVSGGGSDGAPAAPISILRVAVTEKKA